MRPFSPFGPPLWPSGQGSWLQNRNVLCFVRGMNSIYICYVEESRPPVWYSGRKNSGSGLETEITTVEKVAAPV
jgi:hypothetical protein